VADGAITVAPALQLDLALAGTLIIAAGLCAVVVLTSRREI
jgi:hypothetical protein